MRRAARLGDGWLSDWQPAEEIVASIDRIRAYRRELGRDQLPFDDTSVLLRSITGKSYNRKSGFSRWHYVAHPAAAFARDVGRKGYTTPKGFMKSRVALSDYVSWIGKDPPVRDLPSP